MNTHASLHIHTPIRGHQPHNINSHTCTETQNYTPHARTRTYCSWINANNEVETCLCQNCTEMGVESYKLCCARAIGTDLEGKACITNTDAFLTVCTNKVVLRTALGAWHHLNGENMQICNKSYRFIAYKQYILWQYGKLSKGERKKIPTCVLAKIRQTFPAHDGVYVPFSYGH